MYFLVLSLFLTSFSSFASQCTTYKDGLLGFRSSPMISGTRFSYFDQGEVLSSFKIQDQDGLGSCYANALTAAIKVSHRDHPDVSYLHASLQGSIQTYENKGRKLFDRQKSEVFNEGGWVCETFNGLKRSGGACSGVGSGLENNLHQKSLLNSLAGFIDYFQSSTGSKADLIQKLRRLFEEAVFLRRKLKKECTDQKELGFAPIEIIDQNLRNFLFTSHKSHCEKPLKEAIKKLYTDSTLLSPDYMDGEFHSTFIKKMRSTFSSSSVQQSLSKFHVMFEKKIFYRSEDVINPVFNEIEKYIKASVTDKRCTKELIFPQSDRYQIFEEIYLQNLKSGFSDCENQDDANIFERITHSRLMSEEFYCLPSELHLSTQEMISHLGSLNQYLGDNFLDKLTIPGQLNSFDQLMEILMPRCRKRENLVPLNNLNCTEESFSNYASGVRVKKYQEKILSALKEKKGVTVSFCSTFLKSPTFTPTNFCQINPNPIDDHSNHAMSVTGYRCINGKLQFQLLNSWGKTCPPGANQNYRNDYMECELDSRGRPSGKLWVNEDVLFDSTIGVSVVSK